MDILGFIKGEWAVISQAPLTFLLWGGVAAIAAYAFARHQLADQMASLGERLNLKDDRIAAYLEKLQGATPDEAKAKIAALEASVRNYELRLADRVLTSEQLLKLENAIKAFSGTNYKITTYWDLPEPMALANQISKALVRQGWCYAPPSEPEMIFGVHHGVEVYHTQAAESRDAAHVLAASLTELGIAARATLSRDATDRSTRVQLLIGTKPT